MSILFPVFGMVLLTFLVSPFVVAARINSVRTRAVRLEYFEVFRGSEPPDRVIQTTRHWANLYEAPVLFYVACLMAYVVQVNSPWLVGLAWAYVAARMAHSCIHLTYNRIKHRFRAFAISQMILLAMWLMIFIYII